MQQIHLIQNTRLFVAWKRDFSRLLM